MKRVYWRPREVSRRVLLLIGVLALGGLFVVEHFKSQVRERHYSLKRDAAELARQAMNALKVERLRRGLPIDPATDPAQTGLIGSVMTPVTSRAGKLSAKQTSVNPNFAAVVVELLKEAEVEEGDTVAIGFSGSFPALNVCVLAAVQAMKLQPIVISGVSASQWGANEPEFLWLDMEQTLIDRGILRVRSVAASIGGIDDRGFGLGKEGREIVTQSIEGHHLTFLRPNTYQESVDLRMAMYHQYAGGARIKAYINVGGLTSSIGKEIGRKEFKPGINVQVPPGVTGTDSVMARFILQEGAVVINLREVESLARTYGLPISPAATPTVGEGKIFFREQHNRWLAVTVLAVVVGGIWAFIRTDVGFRLLQTARRAHRKEHPEPMV
jgi:poly-gamma-glutamate system protein